MTEPHAFLHPKDWKRPRGYANAIAATGRTVFLAGQIGWNAEQKFESRDFVAQARQALANIVALVREAGAACELRLRSSTVFRTLPSVNRLPCPPLG